MSKHKAVRLRTSLLVGGFAVATPFVFFACASTATNASAPAVVDVKGSCRAISNACHEVDEAGPLPHECHELAHDDDDNACAKRKDECVNACNAIPRPDGGVSTSDASGGDAHEHEHEDASDAAHDVCHEYCECMTATCSGVAGYPFAEGGSCESACAAFPAAEKACFPNWCDDAKAASDKTHLCKHAWGANGLDECK